jgi:hypothetical protein
LNTDRAARARHLTGFATSSPLFVAVWPWAWIVPILPLASAWQPLLPEMKSLASWSKVCDCDRNASTLLEAVRKGARALRPRKIGSRDDVLDHRLVLCDRVVVATQRVVRETIDGGRFTPLTQVPP